MKTIAVTGATSGVGEEIVRRFLLLGWRVYGLSRNEKKLKEFLELSENFIGLVTDITNQKEINRSFLKMDSKVDILVNNAAIFKMDDFINCTYNDIDSIIDTNLKGTMYCTLNFIKKTKNSRIINISSVSGLHGIEKQAIYSASKHALVGFADSLNQEIIKNNILITTIFPGGINTPLWNNDNPYPGEHKENILKPSDIANLVEYISKLENRIVLKEITIFPTNEWH